MPNEFDPYREALVIETITIWPEEYEDWDAATRQHVEAKLLANPAEAADLEYVRMHTGFRRQIRITPADIARVG